MTEPSGAKQALALFAWLLVSFAATTLVLFWRLRPLAGALLVPYLAWVTFAAFLCFAIWRRNPELLP